MFNPRFITDFGDQAVLLPLAAAVALIFLLSGWRRGAFAWTVAVGATLGTILLLKLAFLACGHLLPRSGLVSPSGHTAAAAVVYGGLAGIVMRSVTSNKYWLLACTLAVALLCAVVFGATRLRLGVHTMPEVMAGGMIGVGGAVSSTALAGIPSPAVRPSHVLGVGLVILLLLHGAHLPAEDAIRSAAFTFWPFSACH
jgi:membrane-associated phospholipid phosphatase